MQRSRLHRTETMLIRSLSTQARSRRPRVTRRLLQAVAGVGCGLAGYHYLTASQTEKRKMRVAVEGVGRFFRSISIGLLISLDYWWTVMGLDEDSEEYDTAIQPVHQRSADRIVNGALKNGGLYIKLGQGLGTFNQVLPRQYIDTLKTLQDKALARKYHELDLLFMEDFGQLPSQLFTSFNPEPVAAASLAQVFKGITSDNRQVAIKAQYIDLRDRYEGDIWTVKTLLKLVAFIHPKFSLAWVFEELKETLAEELDFEHEAHNLEQCGRDLREIPYVYVPHVHWELTSKRVLTAEWIDGCRATDKEEIERMGLSKADVAKKVISAFSYQLFITGFVHGDPHPGNVLVRPSPHNSYTSQIVLLDHGLYVRVEEEMRTSLCKIFKSIVKNDVEAVQNESAKVGVKDYELLAVILTGRSLANHRKMFGAAASALTREDWEAVRNTFFRFDAVMGILRALPTSMLICVRNINIVRSINRELGTPVNRFNIMARNAIRGSTDTQTGSWRDYVSTWAEVLTFDLRLMWLSLKLWWSVNTLRTMRILGLVPQESERLEQAMQA